jgi:tetratricopeptide (TPR) repeat protein
MDWTELCAPPACDDAALAWLSDNGLAAPDTRAMQAMVRSVRAESLAGWAAARAASGDVTGAIAALQQALALNPAHLGHRLTLGQWLLDAGRADECQQLVAGLPDAARGGDWPDVVASLIAFGAKDWAAAEQPLLRLAALPAAPINAAAWLGRLHLAQEHWTDAEPWLRRATTLAGGELVWDGLGLACLKLGQADEAISALTQAIAAQPANARLHLLRAIACQQAGQLDRAQDGLWRALAIDPSLGEARRRLGEIARAQADNKKPPGP